MSAGFMYLMSRLAVELDVLVDASFIYLFEELVVVTIVDMHADEDRAWSIEGLLLPSFILMKTDEARTLALHNTVQALASEMAEQRRDLKLSRLDWPRFYLSKYSGRISRRDPNVTKDGFVRFSILK